MRAVATALTSLSLLALAAAPAGADVLKVPKQYPTIQAAIDAAGPGDVVEISKGLYIERLTIDAKSDLTVRAKKGAKVVVDGNDIASPLLTVSSSDDIAVERLRLRNVVGSAVVLVSTCTDVRIIGCRISDAWYGIEATSVERGEVRDCRISGVPFAGIRLLGGEHRGWVLVENELSDVGAAGMVLTGTQHLVAENRFIGVTGSGIRLGETEPCTRTVVRENELDGFAYGISFSVAGNHDCDVVDNVTRSPAVTGIHVRGDRILVEGNRVHGGAGACVGVVVEGGADGRLVDNVVKKCAAGGMVLSTSTAGSVLADNRVTNSGPVGIQIEGSGHALLRNVAHGSGVDCSDAGVDTVLVANEFGTLWP